MAAILPFRDINVHASPSYYAFSSPSSPSAPTLVVDRPSGDLRLNDGKLLGGQRVSSIAGVLGMIKLRLGTWRIRKASRRHTSLSSHLAASCLQMEHCPVRVNASLAHAGCRASAMPCRRKSAVAGVALPKTSFGTLHLHTVRRQVHYRHHQGATCRKAQGPHGVQGCCHRVPAPPRAPAA